MGKSFAEFGQRRALSNPLKRIFAACALSIVFALSSLTPAIAGGETRTISLFHNNTGESLSVVYMKDGRYVPSAMKQINYLMRDWRRNEVIAIDPRTIDLVWELHEDLGSHAPIKIVCGYRSRQTNSLLRRFSRNVAEKSQHIQGKAIDFYFPDIPLVKIRNSSLVRQMGGVGFYPSSNFVHVDSGQVRHWGPYISPSQMAQIFRDGQKTMGRRVRLNRENAPDDTAVAANTANHPGFLSKLLGFGKKSGDSTSFPVSGNASPSVSGDPAYTSGANDMADLSANAATPPGKAGLGPIKGPAVPKGQMASLSDLARDASQAPKEKSARPVIVADAAANTNGEVSTPDAIVKTGRVVPTPRLKPVEIMLMAAANMNTEPHLIRINAASAPPPSQSGKDAPSPLADSLGSLMQAAGVDDTAANTPNVKLKSSLAAELRNGSAKGVPLIKPMIASAGGSDINWWPQLFLQKDAVIRRDGRPPLIGEPAQDSMPIAANPGGGDGLSAFADDLSQDQRSAEGKGDLLVNEKAKSDLEPAQLPM